MSRNVKTTTTHLATLLLLLASTLSLAQETEPEADAADLPRIPATEPDKAPETFEIRPGFRLELAAHEPLIVDPIAMQFDESGRLFVVEMRGYSERREEALGRVKLLVDQDGDGFFDKATIYAEGLKWPTSVCCFDGGIFVTASPDIFYFKDEDGDGVSDSQKTVFTGFGAGREPRLNMQALVNSLRWGPDNRIWGATASNGGKVRRPDQPESAAINLSGADFSFDPRKLDLRAENGTAQYGMSFDSQGRRFVCSNSNHIQWIAWERGWVEPNPYFRLPSPRVSIATDGAAAAVYRISGDEPWRIVRTRWRIAGVVRGMVEGGGRVSGYFTAATGITLYTGDAFGDDFAGNAFVGDAGSNLVHRKVIRTKGGAGLVAERAQDEREIEFLRSTDNWFRPVSFANGPDGSLYVADMYREVIEHPWSLPPGIKKHLDLNSGNDRGRIWRLVPENYERRVREPDLQSPNGWSRVTAQRLSYEAGKPVKIATPEKILDFDGGGDDWAIAFALHRLRDAGAMTEAWKTADAGLKGPLAEMIGKTGDLTAAGAVLGSTTDPTHLVALGEGLRAAKTTLQKADADGKLVEAFRAARQNALRDANSARLLALDTDEASRVQIRSLATNPGAAESVRKIAIGALAANSDAAAILIDAWPTFSPTLRTSVLAVLTAKPANCLALLQAIQAGQISADDVSLNQASQLREHKDAKVKALAAEVLPAPAAVSRESVVARFLPALKLTGDATRGAQIYQTAACITCHRAPDGTGAVVGPDLATFKTAGGESIVTNLFDPNREVAPQYQAYTFNLSDGQTLLGVIADENRTDMTIRMPGGLEKTFPRKQVSSMKSLGRSIMPEGLEETLTPQNLADLLAYIAAAQ